MACESYGSDNEWGWACQNSKTVNRASITYPQSGCHLLCIRSGCQTFLPIHELLTAGSSIKHLQPQMNLRTCSSSWYKSTSTFSAALALRSMIEAVNVSCHLVLVFLATFALSAKTTLPDSLLLSDTYEFSKLSIRYAPNSCVKDSLSNTPRRFCHRGHRWALGLGRSMSMSRCCATSILLLSLSLHRLKPM